MKFTGVLFTIGRKSTMPPMGARGHKIHLLDSFIQHALTQLPGLPLFASDCLELHTKEKIGIIEKTEILEDLFVVYGSISEINTKQNLNLQACNETLGMSFDAVDCIVKNMYSSVYELESATFLGATVVKQNKAAFSANTIFFLEKGTDEQNS